MAVTLRSWLGHRRRSHSLADDDQRHVREGGRPRSPPTATSKIYRYYYVRGLGGVTIGLVEEFR
jgi:hypothetical protein